MRFEISIGRPAEEFSAQHCAGRYVLCLVTVWCHWFIGAFRELIAGRSARASMLAWQSIRTYRIRAGCVHTIDPTEREDFTMSNAKKAPKRKRGAKVVPVLGAAGLLSLAGGAFAATAPLADVPSQKTAADHEIILGEEELSDVSLSTFYVFDKESAKSQLGDKVAAARGCAVRGCAVRGCAVRGCGGRVIIGWGGRGGGLGGWGGGGPRGRGWGGAPGRVWSSRAGRGGAAWCAGV